MGSPASYSLVCHDVIDDNCALGLRPGENTWRLSVCSACTNWVSSLHACFCWETAAEIWRLLVMYVTVAFFGEVLILTKLVTIGTYQAIPTCFCYFWTCYPYLFWHCAFMIPGLDPIHISDFQMISRLPQRHGSYDSTWLLRRLQQCPLQIPDLDLELRPFQINRVSIGVWQRVLIQRPRGLQSCLAHQLLRIVAHVNIPHDLLILSADSIWQLYLLHQLLLLKGLDVLRPLGNICWIWAFRFALFKERDDSGHYNYLLLYLILKFNFNF